jgi:uncharacterized protein (TIGR02996 family)
MTDEAGLLRAICENPADDAPRLVFADWLDERAGPVACGYCHGIDQCPKDDGTFDPHWHCPHCDGRQNGFAERAKWIRVGVGLHMPINHAPGCWSPWDCDHDPDYNPGREPGGPMWVWNRGFICAVHVPAAAFLEHAAELFEAHPITSVRLTDREPHLTNGLAGMAERWGWGPTGYEDQPSARTPDKLLILLDGQMADETGFFSTAWRFYPTREAADAALSRACCQYGRRLVGLPPLPLPPCERCNGTGYELDADGGGSEPAEPCEKCGGRSRPDPAGPRISRAYSGG